MQRERLWSVLFWLCLAAFVGFVLWLPLFPTGDGPLHIYLANVFWQVVRHPHGSYAQFYAVRHIVQPYSLHYYLLLALERWVSPNMAEKLFVVLILATMATGFRALCGVFSPWRGAVSLWVLPLLLNWTLGAGLLNFTFAAGLLLWGLAFYYRCERQPGRGLAGFAFTVVLLILAHPVPLMLLILMVAGDLVLRVLQRGGFAQALRTPAQLAALALAAAGFLIPLLLTNKAQVESAVSDAGFHLFWLRDIASGVRLGLMYLPGPAGWLYMGMLVAMLPVAVALAVRSGWLHRFGDRDAGPADRLLLTALVFLLLTCFFPEHMNGSALFADRMWLLVWLVAAPCATAMIADARTRAAVAGAALGATLLALILAVVCLRPIALEQEQLAETPLPTHMRGIFLEAGSASAKLGSRTLEHSTYPLNYWCGARSFFAHDDVLLNTPWMNLTILPLRTRSGQPLLGKRTPGALIEDPMKFAAALAQHVPAAEAAAARADFLLYNNPDQPANDALSQARAMLSPQQRRWSCQGWPYTAVCVQQERMVDQP